MNILDAYDLTGLPWDAAELAGCSHHTVAPTTSGRAGGDRLIDPFLAKVVDHGKVRAPRPRSWCGSAMAVRNAPPATIDAAAVRSRTCSAARRRAGHRRGEDDLVRGLVGVAPGPPPLPLWIPRRGRPTSLATEPSATTAPSPVRNGLATSEFPGTTRWGTGRPVPRRGRHLMVGTDLVAAARGVHLSSTGRGRDLGGAPSPQPAGRQPRCCREKFRLPPAPVHGRVRPTGRPPPMVASSTACAPPAHRAPTLSRSGSNSAPMSRW